LANEKYLEIVKHFESVTAKPEVEVEDNGTLDMAGEVDIDLPY
jgi:hypothetical protein